MKIYTRTGDKGKTSLLLGGRVDKYDLRVETYGTLDELNSWMVFAWAFSADAEVNTILQYLQKKYLFAAKALKAHDDSYVLL